MEHSNDSPKPTPNLPARAPRHDGWTPDRLAAFLEVLADTGIATDAVRAAGMDRSGAYALRNRDPVFAAAWRAAQIKARPQVADGLLERSITGTVEHYYRDGVLVGERRHYESWLGLAVLKRLDKQAEEDRAEGSLSARIAGDWQAALDALRAGGTMAMSKLLDPEGDEIDEVDTPPSPPGGDPWDDVWRNDDGEWMTTHAPPPGFAGKQNCEWDGDHWYERACTPEEAALLDAHGAAMIEQERRELAAYAEGERDRFFETLRSQLAAATASANACGHGEVRLRDAAELKPGDIAAVQIEDAGRQGPCDDPE
ncbi:MAG: hypothetical protein ACJ8FS_00530 [Sphingomicrobium sp.]